MAQMKKAQAAQGQSEFPDQPGEFDAYADQYEELARNPIRNWFAQDTGFYFERKLKLILDFLRHRELEPERLEWLDVGCGRGELLTVGQSHFRRAAGCDVSQAMIEAGKGLHIRRQDSPTSLPFPDGSFDLVTAVCVYHHVHSRLRPALTLDAIRVLRSGGIFCAIEHNPWNPLVQIIVSRTPLDASALLIRAGQMKRLLRSAGIQRLDTEYFLWIPARLYERLGRVEVIAAHIPLGGQYAVFGSKP
jgi:SAM-dependent methyltransferase